MPSHETTGLPTGGPISQQIGFGMQVEGSRGMAAGSVKTVRDSDFLVDRPLSRDIYIPFGACQAIKDGRVILKVPADQIDSQGWPYAELGGASSTGAG